MKIIKIPFNKFLRKKYDDSFIINIIKRANKITFINYHFIRSYILYLYENDKDIPKIDQKFIMQAFRILQKKSRGPKGKYDQSLVDFYEKTFIKILHPNKKITKDNMNDYKIDGTNLSYILNPVAKEMEISYKNNISYNFFKYMNKYVNNWFKVKHPLLFDNKTNTKSFDKHLKKKLSELKISLINNKNDCKTIYSKFIVENKDLILPKSFSKSYEFDVMHHPYKYIKYMLNMNKFLENNNLKTFQPISLRTSMINKYININTNALIDILPLKNKNDFFKNIRNCQHDLWNQYFNIHFTKIKDHSFNYQIKTDGISVSVEFIHKDELLIKDERSDSRVKASKMSKKMYKTMTDKEIEQYKLEKEKEKLKNKLLNEKKKEEKREKFKKLSKKEKDEIKLKLKLENNEFNYIKDVIECDQILKDLKKGLKNNKLVYGDPGMKDILALKNGEDKFYTYRSSRRLKETKRLKYNKLIDNKRNKTKINNKTLKEYENNLKGSKTNSYKIFMEYCKDKIALNNEIDDDYRKYVQKLKWFGYINKVRHEMNIINEIKRIYGEDAIMIIGDNGGKNRIKLISVPNLGIKRLLKKHFKVFILDEFRSSIINCKTNKVHTNMKLSFNGSKRSIHSIFTYKMENKRMGCINRNKNACVNFEKIVKSLLKKGERPYAFRRSVKLFNLR